MECIVSNLAGAARYTTIGNRRYLVAPMTLIVPGVLNGSNGPLFYSPELIRNRLTEWASIPIVVNHPSDGSARRPEYIADHGVGYVYSPQINDKGNLIAQGWFDVENANRIDPRLVAWIENGKLVELSTGLFKTVLSQAPQGAAYNGQSYTHVVDDYLPDHLAILPDAIGACSAKDGCGVLANELSHDSLRSQLSTQLRERFKSSLNESEYDYYVEDVFASDVVFQGKGKLWKLGYSVNGEIASLAVDDPAEVMRVVDYKPITNKDQTMSKLTPEQKKAHTEFIVSNCECWKDGGKLLNDLPDDQVIAIRNHVERSKENEAIANAAREGYAGGTGSFVYNAEKKEMEFVPNPEHKVEKKAEGKPDPTPTTTNSSEPAKAQTEEEWLASAPATVREDLEFARNEKKRQKAALIEKLVVNVDASRKAALVKSLGEKSLIELTMLQDIIPAKSEPVQRGQQSYVGAAVPGTISNEEPEAPLGLPVWNFEKQSA